MTTSLIRVIIAADPPGRVDKALARDVPEDAVLSRTQIARLISEGAVQRNGTVLGAKAVLLEGDEIEIIVPVATESHMEPEDIALDVVFEDDELIVVNKPAGMVVHPAPGSPSGTLVNALLHHCGDRLSGVGGEKRPGIVHRIDKDTSGLLVVAKTDRAHQGLAAQFEAHTAERSYAAICYGLPDPGDPRVRGLRGVSFEEGWLKITTRLARHKTDRQKQAVLFQGGRHAVTRVKVAERLAGAALVECRLETGRTHQIRVHMAYAGHGLIGDPVYGGKRKLSAKTTQRHGVDTAAGFARQALHAQTLGFVHPATNEALRFSADAPEDFLELLEALKG